MHGYPASWIFTSVCIPDVDYLWITAARNTRCSKGLTVARKCLKRIFQSFSYPPILSMSPESIYLADRAYVFLHNERGYKMHADMNIMSATRSRLAVDDRVYEPFPRITSMAGTVINIYELDGEYRYVVNFEDGQQSVYYARELASASKKPK
jgi:hypothetical protein